MIRLANIMGRLITLSEKGGAGGSCRYRKSIIHRDVVEQSILPRWIADWGHTADLSKHPGHLVISLISPSPMVASRH